MSKVTLIFERRLTSCNWFFFRYLFVVNLIMLLCISHDLHNFFPFLPTCSKVIMIEEERKKNYLCKSMSWKKLVKVPETKWVSEFFHLSTDDWRCNVFKWLNDSRGKFCSIHNYLQKKVITRKKIKAISSVHEMLSLSLLFLDGNSLSGETFKPSGENVAPSNHVVNKNRIPPGIYNSSNGIMMGPTTTTTSI